MNEIEKLTNEARSVIAAYNKGDDLEAVVTRLAAIGYKIEEALSCL